MKKILLTIGFVLLTGFIYYTVSPLFIDKEINDELPQTNMTEVEMQKIIDSTPDQTMDEPAPIRIVAVPTNPNITPTIFPIVDTKGHPATGQIRIVDTETDTVVRYEDYDGTNGPDLFIYLATDLDATEFITLGRSKGNKGNANYTVPEDVDLSDYKYVMTWCKTFGVLFDYAELN
jgi:hypothetical protein